MMTPQQLAVVESVQASPDSISVSAVAGSGKTTTLVAAHAGSPLPDSLFVAFNKSNVEDLSPRLPGVECKTLNSLGAAAWNAHLGRRAEVDTNKLHSILKALSLPRDLSWSDVRKGISLSKAHLLIPPGAPLAPAASPRLDWLELFDEHDLDTGSGLPDQFLHFVQQGLLRSIREGLAGKIDFDDQLYLPVLYDAAFRRRSRVYVDEAQDLNHVQHEMVARLVGDRMIAAGDPHQAIYGFRGAMSNSMTELSHRFSAVSLPLTVSFRCPRSVVAEAQRFVPEIEAFEGAEDGEVKTLLLDIDSLLPGDAILCRNNSPLVSLAFRLLKDSRPFRYIGRAFGEGLVSLINKISKTAGGSSKLDLHRAILNYQDIELAKADNRAKRERIEDKVSSLLSILDSVPDAALALPTILERIRFIFDESRPGITLSTGHRAKGREWPRVWWLEPDLLDLELEAERNLAYVITTRTQHSLFYVGDPE